MTFNTKVKRAGCLLVVAAFALAVFSTVRPAPVAAYGLLSSRSIQMSSSANGATNTAYKVTFTTVTNNQNVGSVVVEFCSNSPILGDTCTPPTGMDINQATLALYNYSGNVTGLTIDTTNSSANRLVLTRANGTVANGTTTFEMGNGTNNGVTNPTTTNTTFFARIITFNSTTGAGDEIADSIDAGGVALSTANQLNVTAKVQETLTFCVYTGINCANGGTAVALGDGNGVLSSTSTTYTNTASYDLASNALGGVAVKLKGDTLKSGSFSITPHGPVCTADVVVTGTEQFGLRVSTVGAGQTADPLYGCQTNNHTFDVANINTVYGQNIASTAGATDSSTSVVELAAKSAGTTEAGVYTTTLTLIATATY
ncbi:MAG TPA: hypothetical protein VF575_03020 [Candidatus Saccharimonadales bacterium]|jgi:hypothetical protein